jgi:hypothetical protein
MKKREKYSSFWASKAAAASLAPARRAPGKVVDQARDGGAKHVHVAWAPA